MTDAADLRAAAARIERDAPAFAARMRREADQMDAAMRCECHSSLHPAAVMRITHDPGQGSNSKYQGGCRCPECRAAHAMELRIWRCRKWLEKVHLPAVARRLREIEAEMARARS